MAAASSSSSSSFTNDGFTYDVFISFRGEDTRHVFTGSLWKFLDDKGIRTFFDKEDLKEGKEITPELLLAIEQSRMALVVLSPNYASSAYCLQELSHILHCIKGRSRLVWPIFYQVEPSDPRWLEKGTYKEAMDAHEATSWYTTDTLQKWKNALHQVANLRGTCTYFKHDGGGYLHEFIAEIVEKVSRQIKPFTLFVADNIVGLKHQMEAVKTLLNVGCGEIVHMVGIHGVGGIGKTTLSKQVYNSIAEQFDGSCFLENVRGNSEKHGLTYLQKILLSEIVGEKEILLTSVSQGIQVIQQRLGQKKVLLLLDDVDNIEQLRAIVGRSEWFGPGSRVIITTRDTGLLTSHGVKSTHEMTGLNKKRALDLLRGKAFEPDSIVSSSCDEDILRLLERAVTIASGLPLALEVIGSHLHKIGIQEWEYALDHYERIPDKKIQKVLEVSFKALEEEEKSAFLDIACCFKGYELARVKKLLHAHHGDRANVHIRVLVEKSLIKITDFGCVTLHDLLEDMGKEIVRRESPQEPGERSRLWNREDVLEVLQQNKGTSKIEVIYLGSREEKVNLDTVAFKRTTKLRTLIIEGYCYFLGSPKYLPNSLRILIWEHCPSRKHCCHSLCSPHDFYQKQLARFELLKFQQRFVFTKKNVMNKFENMRILDLFHNAYLTKIPNISGLPNLEEISFAMCYNLIKVDDSVGLLGKLKILHVQNCRKLRTFPLLKLASLEELDLSFCKSLESFPSVAGESLDKLKILRARNCKKLKRFPLLNLASLEEINLSYCQSLESFPPVVGGLLDKLKILDARNCKKLKRFPLLNLASLEEIDLSYCESLESFPPVVGGLLDKLKILDARNCYKLKSFPPLNLASLEIIDLSFCGSLECFPPMLNESLDKLKTVYVTCCVKLRSFPPLKLASLEILSISNCSSLESFPPVIDEFLGKLKTLDLTCCSMLQHFSPLKLSSLEKLNLSYCRNLKSFPEILGEMESLTKLSLARTPIKELPFSIRYLTGLESLSLRDCGIVHFPSSIVEISKLAMVEIIDGGWVPKQEEGEEDVTPSLGVESLSLLNCNLSDESLATGLKWFAKVKELNLSRSKFTTLPECIENCRFLWKLILDCCEELREIKGIPPSIKVLFATNCKSLTLSCKRKLLNQELHEAGNTLFCLPGAEVPEWFDHKCMQEQSFSFWFRNKLPAIVLCYVPRLIPKARGYRFNSGRVIINGTSTTFYIDGQDSVNKPEGRSFYQDFFCWNGESVHIFHLQIEKIFDKLGKELLEDEWIHVEIDVGFPFLLQRGIHVLKEKSRIEDIRFTKPENDDNISLSSIDSHTEKSLAHHQSPLLRHCHSSTKPTRHPL